MKRIYLDNAATTPIDPDVNEIIQFYLQKEYGNPSSIHDFGLKTREILNKTRDILAMSLGIHQSGVIFTSSGTEADNLALQGIMNKKHEKRYHLITCNIEHPAVYNTAKFLESEGFDVTYLPVSSEGLVDVQMIEAAIKPNTILVSIQYVNNEIGTIQPIREIGRITRARKIFLHTDAVQAYGKIPISFSADNIDLLSLSSHKLYSCKGAGALCISPFNIPVNIPVFPQQYLRPLFYGGHQESSLRPSTENVPAIAGLGIAVEKSLRLIHEESIRICQLRDYLIGHVLSEISNCTLNGSLKKRLYNNANFRFKGLNGADLVFILDSQGIACSTGSACNSQSNDASRVLLSLGLTYEDAMSSVRFSLGRFTTKEDIDFLLEKLPLAVKRARYLFQDKSLKL